MTCDACARVWDEQEPLAWLRVGSVRQCLCVTVRGVGAKPPSSCRGRCTRSRPRRPDRNGRPIHATAGPNDVSAPRKAGRDPRVASHSRGESRLFATVSKTLLLSALARPPARACSETLQNSGTYLTLQMPGVRSKSLASPSPELRRVRTILPTASSKVATARASKVVRVKAPANPKAKVAEEDKRAKSGGPVSLMMLRSPPRPPVGPELGNTRCSWITANSESLYAVFHDEEWGVPVHDDCKLFELLTLSQALAELTWAGILNKREGFREMFDGFNYASVSEFTEKNINMLLRSSGSMLLSKQKIRAVVTNAKQMQKVVHEFGSFSNYCWSFVNHRPITNCFRYARQVPIKTPKSEAISKDLMRRGFQCVGPTTIYSFMQVTGIVNDHLSCCFRFLDCSQHRANQKDARAQPAIQHC